MFSVIIPTYHRNDLLAKCLDGLAPGVQSLSADQYEVIVSDDGRQTTAKAMIQQHYPWVRWVEGPRKGPAANRNNGARYAQREWLVFTDDDCLPDPQWLSAYKEAVSDSALALEGSIHPIGDPNQDLAECPVNLTGGCFWSANIAVKRSVFEALGGFDQSYVLAAHEDQDLKTRLERLTTILFVPRAKVYHPVRIISLKQAINHIPAKAKNWSYHVLKNDMISLSGGPLLFVILHYKFYFLQFLRQLYRLHFANSLLALFGLIYGIPIILFYTFRSKLGRRATQEQ
jgi:GT2 family glycosyltransferase